jgi:hypothetical protein
MSSNVTFEQVDALAAQLSPQEQLRLIEQACQRLSAALPGAPEVPATEAEHVWRERLRLAEALLAESAGVEDDSQGSDTAESIRRHRDKRMAQLWQKGA